MKTPNPPRSVVLKAEKQSQTKAQPGTIWGRLEVLSIINNRNVIARCECGETKAYRGYNLTSGNPNSCGCFHLQRVTHHGATTNNRRTPEWTAWENIRRRCLDPNHPNYKWYGARGVTLTPAWMDFSNFLSDVGPRPGPEYSIDRIDNNGNYTPGNVQWSTHKQQQNNKSSNRYYTYKGLTLNIAAWSELAGVTYQRIYQRLKNNSVDAFLDKVLPANKLEAAIALQA